MKKKILLILGSIAVVFAGVALVSAYEAHVINVTAHIENALYVHPTSYNFGTVFPQEYFANKTIVVSTSTSFCDSTQTRVLNIDYKIAQKPKPRPEFVKQVGEDEARRWCHDNEPLNLGDPNDPYYTNCYPVMCNSLSKTPKYAETGDVGLPSFHSIGEIATGKLHKWDDLSDEWIIDLAVPCFEGMCAQDWADFVKKYNPQANPQDYVLPAGLESQTFGCDLWVEVTNIY